MTAQATSIATLPGIDLPPAGTYVIDPSHSSIGAVARHLVVTKVRGRFAEFAGTIAIDDDDWTNSTAEVLVQTASIDTRNADRDAHLRGADFLDVERFPELRFRSTGVEHTKGNRFRLYGELTIRDVTKSVAFDLTFLGNLKDPWGNDRIAFEASGELDREIFGITWNVALETGGVLVSKKLQFELEVQAVRQP